MLSDESVHADYNNIWNNPYVTQWCMASRLNTQHVFYPYMIFINSPSAEQLLLQPYRKLDYSLQVNEALNLLQGRKTGIL